MSAAQKMHPWVRAWWERTWATWEAERKERPMQMCHHRGEAPPKQKAGRKPTRATKFANSGGHRSGINWELRLVELFSVDPHELGARYGITARAVIDARNRWRAKALEAGLAALVDRRGAS